MPELHDFFFHKYKNDRADRRSAQRMINRIEIKTTPHFNSLFIIRWASSTQPSIQVALDDFGVLDLLFISDAI